VGIGFAVGLGFLATPVSRLPAQSLQNFFPPTFFHMYLDLLQPAHNFNFGLITP